MVNRRGLLCLPAWLWASPSWAVFPEGSWTKSSAKLPPCPLAVLMSRLVQILAGLWRLPLCACFEEESLPQRSLPQTQHPGRGEGKQGALR